MKRMLGRIRIWLKHALSGSPCMFAVCCCGLRGPMYIGDPNVQAAVDLHDFGCFECKKLCHTCWGPRMEII